MPAYPTLLRMAAVCWPMLLLMARALPAQCSLGLSAIIPPTSHTRVIATLLEERIAARFGQLLPVEYQQGDMRKAFGYDHFVEGRLAFGHVVRIRRLDLPAPARLGPDSSAVVVRWYLDGHTPCRMNTRYDSLPRGSHHVFIVKLRAESLWVRDRPTFDVLPGLFTSLCAYDSAAAESLVMLTRMLPTHEAWETDCRPHLTRLGDYVRHLRPPVQSSVHQPMARFHEECRRSVEGHALALEREKSRPVPPELLALYRARKCRDDLHPPDDAVDGRFTSSGADQWVFVCDSGDQVRVLIAILEQEPQIIELIRMAGRNRRWSVQVAPPGYFEWMDSRDFGDRASPAPRPIRDMVLLTWLGFPTEWITAHYQSPRGWENIAVRCCRGFE